MRGADTLPLPVKKNGEQATIFANPRPCGSDQCQRQMVELKINVMAGVLQGQDTDFK